MAFTIDLFLPTGTSHTLDLDSDQPPAQIPGPPGSASTASSLTTYDLKEVIHSQWLKQWGPSPSPGRIRLIHMGQLMEDSEPLASYDISPGAKNFVHMAVRPSSISKPAAAEPVPEKEEAPRRKDSCCCVIM